MTAIVSGKGGIWQEKPKDRNRQRRLIHKGEAKARPWPPAHNVEQHF